MECAPKGAVHLEPLRKWGKRLHSRLPLFFSWLQKALTLSLEAVHTPCFFDCVRMLNGPLFLSITSRAPGSLSTPPRACYRALIFFYAGFLLYIQNRCTALPHICDLRGRKRSQIPVFSGDFRVRFLLANMLANICDRVLLANSSKKSQIWDICYICDHICKQKMICYQQIY